LSLTTLPISVRVFLARGAAGSAAAVSWGGHVGVHFLAPVFLAAAAGARGGGALLLGLDRLGAGDVAARVLELRVVGELLRRLLHAQAEVGLEQLAHFLLEARGVLGAEVRRLHRVPSSFRRPPGGRRTWS
jgi:hypothetical protein